ncbi:MAG: thiamine phosphate synthase [Spirochaetales bacterium]|nr:thiamine phosphate synthase [Spirochaetales bacterium]
MEKTFGLYVIISDPEGSYTRYAEAAVKAGAGFVQLRMKKAPRKDIIRVAGEIRSITLGSSTRFIVNDDVLAAAAVDADGVHLGQDDMPLHIARAIWNEPRKLYGLSTHNLAQARAAAALKPDYIGVGPVFPTPTKEHPDPVLGLSAMGDIVREIPLVAVAIGGITIENVRDVLEHGAVNFCAVRAIMRSNDPFGTMIAFREIWEEMTAF